MSGLLHLPTSVEGAVGRGRLRAGGTDLMERRHHGIAQGDLVDLRDVPGLAAIEETEAGLRIGARVTVASLADSALLRGRHPSLAAAAGGLATPQIRAVATLAGNLLQFTRCWYARNPTFDGCLKRGGGTCYARGGDHLFHGCYDLSPCIAPHPSTLALALRVQEASVQGLGPQGPISLSIEELLDVLETPARSHRLPDGAALTHVTLAPPPSPERGGYLRTIHRSRAEWPLVEASVALGWDGARIGWARVAIGGVGPSPLRQPQVEEALVGQRPSPALLEAAAERAGLGASLLPGSAYKVQLIAPTVLGALEQAIQEGVR